jgi:hypothetical protein
MCRKVEEIKRKEKGAWKNGGCLEIYIAIGCG